MIWLIGSGKMAIEYARVLSALNCIFKTIGRGNKSAQEFYQRTGIKVVTGGLASFLKTKPEIPLYAIVATGVEALAETTIELMNAGVINILCEKPGGINGLQIKKVCEVAKAKKANVLLAYNRRFYSSVEKASEIIEEDKGVISFNFEFTEWGHLIEPLVKAAGVKDHWFLGNSTHVVDLAFYLGGVPREIKCFISGGLSWHPSASVFAGAGVSKNGTLFSYHANWNAPGRWSLEILTRNNRLYFRPLEKLQLQKKGSVDIEFVKINDNLDLDFKPGLFKQTKEFIKGNHTSFISIQEQLLLLPVYMEMAGYQD